MSDDGQRFEPVTIRTGRLSPTGDPPRVSIGVEVRPERDMVGLRADRCRPDRRVEPVQPGAPTRQDRRH